MGEESTVTKQGLILDLQKLGVKAGQVIMLHASIKSVGWIVGGPDMVLEALFEILGREGTLMMYVGWDQSPYHLAKWSSEKRNAVLNDLPAFQPNKSRAMRKWSILTEYIRTWPNAFQSNHPEATIVAVGKEAEWLTKDHPFQYGYGTGSPLEKFCKLDGKVLMLGAPLSTMTVLHYAEHIANIPNKKIARYEAPILENGVKIWKQFEEFDTSQGIVDWPKDEDYFLSIGNQFFANGHGIKGNVGSAVSYNFDAKELVNFGKVWMEEQFQPQVK